MSVKGNVKENLSNEKYVGYTEVDVVAINPTREQLNKVLDREPQDDDKEIDYLSTDQEGNEKVRISFWMKSKDIDKFFVYSFNLINKIKNNKDKTKIQVINSTLNTSWVPLKLDEQGEVTEEADMDLLPDWFTTFKDRRTNEELGEKIVRPALVGEEELATIVRAWFGQLNFSNPDTEVTFNNDEFFAGNFGELQEQVNGDFSKSFVILLGVKTDEDDSTKQYQQVYGKSFLPSGTIKHLEKNFLGSSDYIQKTYSKFEEAVEGEYGFKSFYKLEPIQVYNPKEDPSQQETVIDKTPVNSKF